MVRGANEVGRGGAIQPIDNWCKGEGGGMGCQHRYYYTDRAILPVTNTAWKLSPSRCNLGSNVLHDDQ